MKVVEGKFGKEKGERGPTAVLEDIREAMEGMGLEETDHINYIVVLAAGPSFGMTTNMENTSNIIGALEITRMTVDDEFKARLRGIG